jgi:uncharacterized membrane protein
VPAFFAVQSLVVAAAIIVIVVIIIVVVVAAAMVLAHGLEAAEKAVALVIRPSREIERPGNPAPAAVAKRQCPQTLNDHGLLGGRF